MMRNNNRQIAQLAQIASDGIKEWRSVAIVIR
jgi:hypothetical protein